MKFPMKLHKFICHTLDVEDKVHQRDWTQIAIHSQGLKLSQTEIRHIKDLKNTTGKSPTENLLNQWEEKGHTIEQFEVLMEKIGLRNIVNEIEKFKSGDHQSYHPCDQ